MATIIKQQVALDETLVPSTKRLRIGRSNFRLPSDMQSKESTLQVVYDVLRRCPFFQAFLVTADVPEIYMQEFWATATVHHHSIRFKINNKKIIINLENLGTCCMSVRGNIDNAFLIWEDFVYQIEHKKQKKGIKVYYPRFTKVIVHHFMSKDLSILRRNKVKWHYVRDDNIFSTIKVVSRHQNTQQYGAILPVELTNEDIRNTTTYKEYYSCATGVAAPKLKASARKKRGDSDTSLTPPIATPTPITTAAPVPRITAAAKGKQPAKAKSSFDLSKVARTEAKQLKIILRRSRHETHFSIAKIDEPEDTKSGGDDEEVTESDMDDEEKETRQEEEESFDPIPRTPEESEDDSNDEEDQGLRLSDKERIHEEEEAEDLYRDSNRSLDFEVLIVGYEHVVMNCGSAGIRLSNVEISSLLYMYFFVDQMPLPIIVTCAWTMPTTIDQQVALDEALIPSTAFLMTADVPEVYMQEFWATAKLHHNSIHFKMDTKKSVLDLEAFREMLHISPRISSHSFTELPSEEEIMEINWHYVRDDILFTTIKVVSRHQTTQQYGAILPIELTTEDIRNSKVYKEYYACATREAAPKPKASARKKKGDSASSTTPPTLTPTTTVVSAPRLSATAKDVERTEAEQLKIILKRSRQETHISQQRGFGTDEGTGSRPGVLDVPSDDSEEELSWNSFEEKDVDIQEEGDKNDESNDESDDGSDDGNDDDMDETVKAGSKSDKDDEENDDEEELTKIDAADTESDKGGDEVSERSEDESNDEEDQELRLSEEARIQEEEEEADELYCDVNINQGRGLQVTQNIEDSHRCRGGIYFTTTSSSIVSLQTPTPIMTPSTIATITTSTDASIPPTIIPSIILENLPMFNSAFRFDERLRSLETTFFEYRQTNPFVNAVSAILGIVHQYITQQMTEAVREAVQIQTDRLQDSLQQENDEFLRNIDENMKKIIKGQVKSQVKEQVSRILPQIEESVNATLEAEVLTRSSHSSRTSYAIAADLSEMELKKILIEKMEGNKQEDDDQEGPSTGSDRGSKRQKEGGEHALASTPSETATGSAGRSTTGSQSRQLTASESAFVEELVQTTCQMEEPPHPVFETGADDKPIVQTSQHLEWFSQPRRPPSPDRDWNKTLPAAQGDAQSWISNLARQTDARSSFNEILDTLIDFSNFIMNRLNVNTLTPKLLASPTYELMRGSCTSLTELEYHLEEVYKATTDQLDWVNPEGQQYPHDLLQPLSLIPDNRGRRVIPFDHFINNDLEYLRGGASSRKYTTSVTKTKAADYGHIKWIEDLVPRMMWIQEPINYDRHALWGVSHWGRKRDFKRLRLQDIEDMLLLLVQGKLSNLTVEERFAFNVSLRMFTRSIVIKRRVEDLQLGVESYQKRLNLTKPDTYKTDLRRREAYTAYSNPRVFIYQNKDKKNIFMRIDELHKFTDGMLNDVRNALDDRLKGIRMQYLPTTIWRRGDKDRAAAMIQAIEKMLKTRRIMRSLDKFIGGRLYKRDFRMLQRTI
nr:hypothetical protein [Tanacetum cinerariifolium]